MVKSFSKTSRFFCATKRLAIAALLFASVLFSETNPIELISAARAQSTDKPWAGLGREATADEVKAWDIDVRADFKGLPAGQGSVDDGLDIWEGKCESCHGTFGESNEVFTPLAGGTTAEDIKTGHASKLTSEYPHRSTLMRLANLSTLWDYINRAMPWNAPKSLTTDEVYAVTAYLLSLGEIVPDDFVLTDENIASVQNRLPNRNGLKPFPGMRTVNGKPDVQGDPCMKDCEVTDEIRSFIPDFARASHGDLTLQHRTVGPFRGVKTTEPAPATLAEAQKRRQTADEKPAADLKSAAASTDSANADASALALAKKHNCLACHAVDKKVLGPAFVAVAEKYAGTAGALELLSKRIREGATGTWGAIPMPANPAVTEADANAIVTWVLGMTN
jgi:cytochrome c